MWTRSSCLNPLVSISSAVKVVMRGPGFSGHRRPQAAIRMCAGVWGGFDERDLEIRPERQENRRYLPQLYLLESGRPEE
jgi:hypothetical protein